MLSRFDTKPKQQSLMAEYVSHVGEAVLRQRARVAETSARVHSELADKIRSEFLSNMSHELRTPLNTIIGFSKLLTEHGTRHFGDAEIVDYAGMVHDAAKHLLSVINDVLDMSRLQSGGYILDKDDVDLDAILRSSILALVPAANHSRLTLRHDIAPDLLPVRGDAAKLRQVFGNIISNAIKFTPPGGSVIITATNEPGGRTAVRVRDTGVGMTADDITIALAPFSQIDGGPARWRDGAGLGLPIANALTLLHEGQLKISSEPSRGTEVTITLPSAQTLSIAEARQTLFEATVGTPDP